MAKLWKVAGSVNTILCSAARCRFNCGAHSHQVENVAFDIDLNLKANMRLPARNLRTLVEASTPDSQGPSTMRLNELVFCSVHRVPSSPSPQSSVLVLPPLLPPPALPDPA
jgi:hypothetical protein